MGMMTTGVILGALLAWFVIAVFVVARAGGVSRAGWGLTVAGRGALDPAFEAQVLTLMGQELPSAAPLATSTPPPAPAPAAIPGEPLRLLAILQAEARLIDFLLEDVANVEDKQLGEAVKDIHRKAAAALRQHLTIETILAGTEGDRVTVPVGFDPAAVRVIGNVTGTPPFQGELQHPGWRVTQITLPTIAGTTDLMVLQPAEVQMA
jgi:hypothetical protein